MTKYKKLEEKSLSEIVGERKSYYLGKIENAFDRVYRSKDFAYIERFEQAVLLLNDKFTKGRLEEKLLGQDKKPLKRKTPKVDTRPLLTMYRYAKARDKGMENEQIKEKFRLNSSYQLCGFSRWYSARKKMKKKGSRYNEIKNLMKERNLTFTDFFDLTDELGIPRKKAAKYKGAYAIHELKDQGIQPLPLSNVHK